MNVETGGFVRVTPVPFRSSLPSEQLGRFDPGQDVAPPTSQVDTPGFRFGPILVSPRRTDAPPRVGQPSAAKSPAGSASVAMYHRGTASIDARAWGSGRADADPNVMTAAKSPRASPKQRASNSPSTITSGRPGRASRGWKGDKAGGVAKALQILRRSLRLGEPQAPGVGGPNLDHRQSVPVEPRDDNPRRPPRHSVRPRRPPDSGAADRLD